LTQAFISPQMLAWARDRQHATEETLAASLHVKVDKVREWQRGEALPTFRQAERLAAILKVPLPFLYLKSPPRVELPLPDRRTTAIRLHPVPSPDFLDTAHAVMRKQDWYRDYRKAQAQPELDFVGSCNANDDPLAVARKISDVLALPQDHYRGAKSWTDHVGRLTRAAEAAGILVFRSGIVGNNTSRTLDVSEFRGMAFSDRNAPAVFINARDSVSAQVFTLAHELAHLWIGESAATDAEVADEESDSWSATERFCDRVATEFLVPTASFLAHWKTDPSIREALLKLPSLYRVSSVMVLRRAYELGLVSRKEFFDHLRAEKGNQRVSRKDRKGGSFYNNFGARNGQRLVGSIFESVSEGRTLYREAASILEIKVGTLGRLLSRSALATGA
jgi:Zn-dependent peptidase ImmA (M78 family)